MAQLHFWRIGVRLAWRDLRNSRSRSTLITLAMAVSIAGVAGVHGAVEVGRLALRGDARAWLAGDLCIDTREPIDQSRVDALDRMKQSGLDWTLMTTALTMVASDQSPDAAFVAVKAIDPSVFPFYGALTLSPPQKLSQALQDHTVVVSDGVLERLQVRVGDTIHVAGQPFRIAALIGAEPDRFSGELGMGMRCILSTQGYQRTEIERAGNSVKHRVLVRLDRAQDLTSVRRRLLELIPEGNVRDYRGARRQETRLTETMISFVSVTAFLALTLGAIGIAIATRQHADESIPKFAIMRMLGARSPQMAVVFFLQLGAMMTGALAMGVPLGLLLRISLLSLGGRYMVLPQVNAWQYRALLESAVAGMIAMAPVLVQPALMILHIRPAAVLRQGFGEASIQAVKTSRSILGWAVAGVATVALAALAYLMLRSWHATLLLVAALAGSIGAAWLLAALALGLLRRCSEGLKKSAPLLGHGIAGLYRQGNRSLALIVALATALSVMIATFEGSAAVVQAVFNLLPYDRNSLYVANFKDSNIPAFLKRQPGVEDVSVMTQARLELRTVKGPSAGQSQEPVKTTRQQLARPMPAEAVRVRANGTCDAGYALDAFNGSDACIPISIAERLTGPIGYSGIRSELLQASGGANALTGDGWHYYYSQITAVPQIMPLFPAADRNQVMTVDYYLEQRANAGIDGSSYIVMCKGRLTLAEDLAHQIGAKIGSRLAFETKDKTIQATVADIRKFTPVESFWSNVELNCSGLDPSSLFQQAAVRIHPDQIANVRRAIRGEYPTLAVITPEDIAGTVTAVSNDATSIVRLVAWFAIAAGFSIVIAVVAASRAARLSEIGIFSALGARRATMLEIYSIEFAATGVLSGLIAGVLTCGFASVTLSVVFQKAEIVIAWKAIAAAIVFAAVLTVAAGWLPTYGLLRRKPMEILRRE